VQTDIARAKRFKKRVTYGKNKKEKEKSRDFSRDVFEKKNIEDTLGSNFI
jgi:hypothetical protein